MNLRYSKRFEASLRKLSPDGKTTVIRALELLQENPFEPSLDNHPLAGRMTGKRAIAVDNDLRIVFTERGNHHDVTLLDVGSHADVYRR
ncbi:MAG TPA: type II toxin-antitoxin system mRNA interferase toxin, RelE/StbE family [Stellaceae bacterium]|nr:type II toxin-antitoxin system mRNA interferase toxin, RelE/StbE family [Stellaceae bacterium]